MPMQLCQPITIVIKKTRPTCLCQHSPRPSQLPLRDSHLQAVAWPIGIITGHIWIKSPFLVSLFSIQQKKKKCIFIFIIFESQIKISHISSSLSDSLFASAQVVYKNNDIRLELSRLARIVDPKMKIQGDVVFKCENVATLDPISFETPEAYISLPKWNTKRMGSISFDFRTTEPNGLILFTHGKPQERKDARSQKNTKVDFFAVELLDGSLYLLLDMGSGTIKVKATLNKVNDGAWYHVDIQRDGRSGQCVDSLFHAEHIQ